MKKATLAVTAALVFTAGSALASGHGAHWGYSGEGGPEHWGTLDPAFEMCGKGVNQSPINMTDFIEGELAPITFNYSGLATEVVNNGHAIQANYAAGSTITIDGKTFELKQFHFHSPSENHLNGKSYPMESHFVHVDKDGNIAVIGVFYEIGEANAGMAKLWKQMPKEVGGKAALAAQVKADELLPADRDYYRFNGSLTTPPCSEGVYWLMMKKTVTVSEDQVKQFTGVMGHPNNRPIQPTGARPVLQ